MKKSLPLCAALFGAVLFSSHTVAADGLYTRASAAWFEPADRDGFDGELGTLVAVGRNIGPHSVELEVGYVELSDSVGAFSADLEIIPVTVGYRYNFDLGHKLTLGLGANTGVAVTDLEVRSPFGSASDDDTVWIASAGARLGYAVTDTLSLTAGYRYVLVDDLTYFGGATLDDTDTHIVELGLEVRW